MANIGLRKCLCEFKLGWIGVTSTSQSVRYSAAPAQVRCAGIEMAPMMIMSFLYTPRAPLRGRLSQTYRRYAADSWRGLSCHSMIWRRTRWLGKTALISSASPVLGLVVFVSSQRSIAFRS